MLYCTEWFMSVFSRLVRGRERERERERESFNILLSRSLPWGAVLRVWDMFFFEGPKVLFKVALAILNLSFGPSKAQKKISGFFELTRALRDLSIDVTHEDVLVPEVYMYSDTLIVRSCSVVQSIKILRTCFLYLYNSLPPPPSLSLSLPPSRTAAKV